MVQMRSLNLNALFSERWEGVEGGEDLLFVVLGCVSITCTNTSNGGRRESEEKGARLQEEKSTYASSISQLEIRI
jgi:hypothetical protein